MDPILLQESEIIPNLYVSGDYGENNYHKYNLIINCNYPFNYAPKDNLNMLQTPNGVIFNIGLEDSLDQDIKKFFILACNYARIYLGKNLKVLVHCKMGISRSVTIAAAILIGVYNMNVERAINLIKSKRYIANPNINFLNQLSSYKLELLLNDYNSIPIPMQIG